MIQYLLNATAIWLVSLLAFDLFLKKQSHHSYNRLYLLTTLISGAILPLWQWQEQVVLANATEETPITQAVVLKHTISQSEGIQKVLDFEGLLLFLYLSGVVISLLFVQKEALQLTQLYRHGKKSKQDTWTIVETGKPHGPFSAFRTIFISGYAHYNKEQLHIVLMHEAEHGRMFHFADLLLMQLCKVVFWFHPLVYLYHSRLMMIHEYQADSAISIEPSVYGSFLIEQSMLTKAPLISHSFHRSPIKNRIMMLNRETSKPAAKLLLPLPLLLICMLCFTKNSFSGGKPKLEGNKMTYKGNVFEMVIYPNDTIIIENPMTGEQEMRIATRDPKPIKINGVPIYDEAAVNTPVATKNGTVTEVRNELAEKLKLLFRDLKDGKYTLQLYTMVVNNKGKVVYQSDPYINIPPNLRKDEETKQLVNTTAGKIVTLLEEEAIFSPAIKDGKTVASQSPSGFSIQYQFDVKDHVVTYVQ